MVISEKVVVKIKEDLKDNTNPCYISLGSKISSKLSLIKGDAVEIFNPVMFYKVAGIFDKEFKDEESKGSIRMSKHLRRNLGAPIGSMVTLRKDNAIPAEIVTFSFLSETNKIDNPEKLVSTFENFVLMRDSILTTHQNGDNIDLYVENFIPIANIIKITHKTEIYLSEASHIELLKSFVELEIEHSEDFTSEEEEIINRLRDVIKISSKIRLDMLMNILNMEQESFDEKIVEWQDEFNFTFDENFIKFEHISMLDFIDSLEKKFINWEKSETSLKKKEKSIDGQKQVFEEVKISSRIFKAAETLDIDYLTNRLAHREKQLSLLSQLFLPLLTHQKKFARNILITGGKGVGKSIIVKLFSDMIIKASQRRSISIKSVFIDCKWEPTSHIILNKIMRELNINEPKEILDLEGSFNHIFKFLETENTHLLLVLDNLNYQNDLQIYKFISKKDKNPNSPKCISLIGIVRDISLLEIDDGQLTEVLRKNRIKIEPYTLDQTIDILRYRVELSLIKNVISDDLIRYISKIIVKFGDIREGLNILWRSGRIAESMNLNYISPECIKYANREPL
ncbi:MAG: hypothetical protein ACTSPS_10400 [Promethearchaeota archaeon]